jgi:hypothetical protein
MRFIPTRVHGAIDYLTALVLIAAPWALGFGHEGGAQTWVPLVLGVAIAGMSLFTDYEWGVIPAIPMSTHLIVDLGGGVLLAASPWLFGFADRVWAPHVIVGLFEIGTALMTEWVPGRARALGGRRSAAAR